MWNETEFYRLFDQYKNHDKVRVVAYTLWEKIWCLKQGIDVMGCPVIVPLGKTEASFEELYPELAEHNTSWKEGYTGNSCPEVFVPRYTNDNYYFDMLSFIEGKGISAHRGPFRGAGDITEFKCCVLSPDAMSKLFCFETIHNNIPVVLPSPKRLLELCAGAYLFNVTGQGGAHLMTEDLTIFCEWYREDFKPIRYYYDTLDELPDVINSVNKEELSDRFEVISKKHEKVVLEQWRKLYATF
jgi:hypothetical protein